MLPNAPWCSRTEVKISLKVAAWNLGKGEASVFSFACQKPGYRALVDDLAARRCASTLGIKFLGTGACWFSPKKEAWSNLSKSGSKDFRSQDCIFPSPWSRFFCLMLGNDTPLP